MTKSVPAIAASRSRWPLQIDGDDLNTFRPQGVKCTYQGWPGGERLSDAELTAQCVKV
jgi:hypothetical protein